MPRFTLPSLPAAAPKPGTHIARIAEIKERVSEAGNVVWSILARFVDKSELRFYVTFADSEKSRKLVVYFARSLGLAVPDSPGAQIDFVPEDALGRLFYCEVTLDQDGAPRITKFLHRDSALALRPELAQIPVAAQPARTLKPFGGGVL
jgi:hypothetical protein